MTKPTRVALALVLAAIALPSSAIARPRHPAARKPLSTSLSETSGPVVYLLAARSAAAASRYPDASDSLGLAETRLLNDAALTPNQTPPYLRRALTDVAAARGSAACHQSTRTVQFINDALLALEPKAASRSAETTTLEPPVLFPVVQRPLLPPVAVIPLPPALPTTLYRLDPGHWQLHGATSDWIEPQSVPQPVTTLPVVASREVWNGDKWVLVPEHFAGTEISP